MKSEQDNSDPMCFHECPLCQARCNCDTVYCTHCEEGEVRSDVNLDYQREDGKQFVKKLFLFSIDFIC